ncbi:MAG: Arc family DNA-binding protein [Candidatus Merdivicinus sp.]
MKNSDMQQFTLRIDRELFQKFRYVADYEGRSANRDLEQYIKRKVHKFEQDHGPILLTENDDE